MLTTFPQKARWIERLGIELLLCAPFDEEMLGLSPRRFVCEVLLSRLKMREIVEGPSFTFGEDRGLTVETHLFDFHREIYGQEISLHFVQRLRSEMKFSGHEELIRQMEKDAQEAQRVLEEAMPG